MFSQKKEFEKLNYFQTKKLKFLFSILPRELAVREVIKNGELYAFKCQKWTYLY